MGVKITGRCFEHKGISNLDRQIIILLQMEHGGGMVFGEETEGEGISNSL